MSTKEFQFPSPGVPTIPLERLDLDSDEAARYVAQSRPFVAKVDWPALAWTPESLRQKIGQGRVFLYKRTGERVDVSVSEFLDFVDSMRSGTYEYVPQNFPVIQLLGSEANPEFACLLDDLRLPNWMPTERISGAFVWLKNMGYYDNKSHAEPNPVANLNLQVRGKKHVWLFPPEETSRVGTPSNREEMMEPPYFSPNQTVYRPSEEHPEFANVRCYEAVLEAGDILHIPTFWYHWFVHYDTYQINVNVWFHNQQVPLSPLSAEWAYMRALGVALGGFDVAPARYAALPLETQDLLTKIASTVREPVITDVRRDRELYVNAQKLGFAKANDTKK